jgi:hypothetical protein
MFFAKRDGDRRRFADGRRGKALDEASADADVADPAPVRA